MTKAKTTEKKPTVKKTSGKRGRPKSAGVKKPVTKKTAKRGRPAKTAVKKPAVKKAAIKKAAPAPKAPEKSSTVKLAIAPIGWTNDDLPELGGQIPFEQCVSEMALAGFAGSEVGNKYPKDPAVLNRALKLRRLTICNAWFSSFLTTKPYEEVEAAFINHRDFLHAVGARIIGAAEQGHSIQGQNEPVFDAKPVFSSDEWKRLINGLNKLGERAAEKGMKLTYHHHMGTGVQTTAEIDRLMENTDPKLLGLLYDTGHLVFSGEDHLAVLDKWMSRIRHVHLKDMRPAIYKQAIAEKWSFLQAVKAGVFTVPGDGCIDFVPVFRALQKAKYSGWWVVEAEQDPAKANPLEYAIKARSYIWEKADI
ncbi:MAG: myo-inosose-2 dehydratase [Treponema sp.]|jgi:inosose dehydratase|nr:myo-inosose-2 dehydratase [Treponema sp.]